MLVIGEVFLRAAVPAQDNGGSLTTSTETTTTTTSGPTDPGSSTGPVT